MKSILVSLLFISISLMSASTTVHSQTISESYEAHPTSFRITSDTLDLSPTVQQIVERGQTDRGIYSGSESSYAYGMGYRSLHLEFQCAQTLVTQKRYDQRYRKREIIELQLFDQDGQQLARQELDLGYLRQVTDARKTLYTFSLDLKSIPLILLDQTEHINLVWLNLSRKHQP